MKESLKDKSTIVYCAVNSQNGGKYIGVTSRGLKKRIYRHKDQAKDLMCSGHFQRALRKYGFESFNWYVLSNWDNYQDALKEEIRVIALVKPEYNSTLGGEGMLGNFPNEETRKKLSFAQKGRIVSEETRKKMSESHKGKPSHMKGKKHSDEAKEKNRISHLGNNSPWKGKKHSPETIAKIIEAKRNNPQISYWKDKTMPRDMVEKIRISKTGIPNPSCHKPVVCLNDNKVFETVTKASEFYNLSRPKIDMVCNGKRKSCGGKRFTWHTESRSAA